MKRNVQIILSCTLFAILASSSLVYMRHLQISSFNQGWEYGWLTGHHEGTYEGYREGYEAGFEKGVEVVSDFIYTNYGITVECVEGEDGTYIFTAYKPEGAFTITITYHCEVLHHRNGVLLSRTYHPMTQTNTGKNWTAHKISGKTGSGWSLWARNMTWIGNSNQSDSVSATWTILPDEITTDGLERALAAWTSPTGIGTANLTKQFTASGSNSTQTYGGYLGDLDGTYDNTLICVEKQGSIKNLDASDTLTVTIQMDTTT